MKFSFATIAALVASVTADALFSHANLKVAPGQYEGLSDEFRSWYESD